MTKIFIVEGSTGEYSDHSEWLVKAFRDENMAKEFTELCAAEYRRVSPLKKAAERELMDKFEILEERSGPEYDKLNAEWAAFLADPAFKHKYDPDWQEDYTGTNYGVLTVDLADSVAEAIGGVEITDHKFEPVEGRAWKACSVCGIIERTDGIKNSPCKGPAHLRPLEVS